MTVLPAGTPQTKDINQASIPLGHGVDFAKITKSAWQQDIDLREVVHIQSPCKSDNSSMKGIQRTIKNLQIDLERIKRFSNVNSAVDALTREDQEPGKSIKRIVNFAATDISGYVTNILGNVRGWVMNTVQDQVKKKLPFLFPGEMPSFIDKLDKGLNGISCAFAKIMRGLAKTIGNLLLQMLDKFVNGPMCFVENFIGNLLKKIMKPIENAIKSAVNKLDDALGRVANLAGSLFNALDFITGFLNFFKCDDDKACPSVQETTLSGAGQNNPQGGDPVGKNALTKFATPSDTTPACPINPLPCGPPRVQFFGGKGVGAMVNAIVSPNSKSIIGFDIINPGFNYLTPPFANIVDECGNGSGASLVVQTRPSPRGGLEIKNIVVTAPGDGYLPAPDGSLGGNGIVWKNPDECYVKTSDGRYYVVPDCRLPENLPAGDVFFPATPPSTSPQPSPQQNDLTYNVVTVIDEVYVEDPGFSYQPGDTLEVVPNNGAVLQPVINDRGEISQINVIKPGVGFVDIPEIVINSPTGYNARLIPVLRAIPIEAIANVTGIAPGTPVVSVVDCVGRVPPRETFDIVPR
jgi:hypothetical protein